MIQTLTRNWWLLALCGVFDAMTSVVYLSKLNEGFRSLSAIVLLGLFALAAGASKIAAGSRGAAKERSWLLVLNGLAHGTLGLIFTGVFGFKISLRTIALLVVVMALSAGVLAVGSAQTLLRRHRAADGWLLGLVGAVSFGYALAFFALGFRWIALGPDSHTDLFLLGSYFGFSAVCMLGLASRLHDWRGTHFGVGGGTAPSPKPAA